MAKTMEVNKNHMSGIYYIEYFINQTRDTEKRNYLDIRQEIGYKIDHNGF